MVYNIMHEAGRAMFITSMKKRSGRHFIKSSLFANTRLAYDSTKRVQKK